MNVLSQEHLITRLVKILSSLAYLASSSEPYESDAGLLELGLAEKDESVLLLGAAGYGFIVPGNPCCSLLTAEEYRLLRHLLDSWDELPFRQRALAKEVLFLLSTILPPTVPRLLGRREGGEPAMEEMAIARMRLSV